MRNHVSARLWFVAGLVAAAGVGLGPRAAGLLAQVRGVVAAPELDHPANANADFSPAPPVVARTPEDQATQFWLPPGYRMEPVLADPIIEDPGQVVFDGNGRMFLVELRGYFQTLDGIDLVPPEGRISLHEDRDNDGTFERHTVFVDKLVFPRFVLPLRKGEILTMETNADEIWKYVDSNDDGVADRRELFMAGFGRAGTMEIQPSSLFWAMDNWLYSTVNAFRLRWTPHGIVREPTGPNRAQWGISQDNDGKLYFQGGSSGLPGYFQFPVRYGDFAAPDQLEPNLNILWGAPILTGDVQQGLPHTRMPDGSLIYATASAGSEIYRGHRMPPDLAGDYLYGEVVGRIVRRLRPVKTEGLTQLRNVYTRSEFIRSLDPLFRPVDIETGPDGAIYIADMYRGIIEGAQWAKEGTYLRAKIRQHGLDKVVNGHGRVWRLVHEDYAPDRTRPRMLDQRPSELVAHLSHANGWWRDMAQRLIVLSQDRSVAPALVRLVRSSSNPLARLHAMWTLEGLGALDTATVRDLFRDRDAGLRIGAIQASETLYKAGERGFAADYRALATDTDVDVAIQALLTLNTLKVPDTDALAKEVLARQKSAGVQFVANRLVNPPGSGRGGGPAGLTADQRAMLERGSVVYQQLCFTCHAEDGTGTPAPGGAVGMTVAPSLAGSPRVNGHRDYVIRTILHGLTGPIDGRSYSQVMVPLGANTDDWIADVSSFVRNSFGNAGGFVAPSDVARVRAATAGRTRPWTVEELDGTVPKALVPDANWRVTASHEGQPEARSANAAGGYNFQVSAAGALSYLGWTTGVPQTAGMWLQIELPASARIAEIQFTSSSSGGGRGAPAMSTHPRRYRVQVSDDGVTWSPPVAEGQGQPGVMTITFEPVTARFVRLTQMADEPGAPPWSMRQLRLFAVGSTAP